ncbi:MAG: DUF1566 domain-containing protein [Desulfatibacillaceae bacterium]|nr:DUF1566 domain-containing protein [Desulfatibacillaceae bacterium]
MNLFFASDQNFCFDSFHNRLASCAGTGQDGQSRAGRPWPNPRFEAAGALVFDRLTELVWPKDASVFEFALSFDEALKAVEEMNRQGRLGRSNWRLPTRRELFSLISHAFFNPALPKGHPFINVFPGYFWSKTPCARFPKQAWTVHLGGGRVFQGMRHASFMVLPVSGQGEAVPENKAHNLRFEPQNEGFLDTATGLVWHRNPNLAGKNLSWQDALESIRQLNSQNPSAKRPWRLPGVREMESLLHMDTHSPALPPGNPFAGVAQACWTSTTSVYDPAYAWAIYMEDGRVGVGYKTKPDFGVWPVC